MWLAHTYTHAYQPILCIFSKFVLSFEKHAARNGCSALNWYAIEAKPRRESRQLLQTRFHEIRTSIRNRSWLCIIRSIDRSLNALRHLYFETFCIILWWVYRLWWLFDTITIFFLFSVIITCIIASLFILDFVW